MSVFFSRFMGNESQCGTNKSHENRFAVHASCLFRTAIHFPWTEKKRHSFRYYTHLWHRSWTEPYCRLWLHYRIYGSFQGKLETGVASQQRTLNYFSWHLFLSHFQCAFVLMFIPSLLNLSCFRIPSVLPFVWDNFNIKAEFSWVKYLTPGLTSVVCIFGMLLDGFFFSREGF